MSFLKHRTAVYYTVLALGVWQVCKFLFHMFVPGPDQSAVIPLAEPGIAIFLLPLLALSFVYGLVFAGMIIVGVAEIAEALYKAAVRKLFAR